MTDIRGALTERALEVGALLNLIEDDDEREQLQAHYEQILNDELYAGSLNRRAAAPLLRALERLGLRCDANVIPLRRLTTEQFDELAYGRNDIHSRKEPLQ